MDSLVKTWIDADWESVLARVDGEIRAIADRQDAAEEGKKFLLGESKNYRENTDKEQRKAAVPLIKAFQKAVDQLTLRGKATEAALIEICRRVAGLPDPSTVLSQCAEWRLRADRVDRAEDEAKELRQNIQDLHRELADLHNQDVTIRQLRERIKQLETEKVQEVELSSVETEKILRKEFAVREQAMSLRSDKMKHENGVLEKKVSELEARMKDAQRRLDSARLEREQKEALESEQIDILNKDLSDANRRINLFEVEVARLTSELAQHKAHPPRSGIEDIAALGGLMKEKDEQIAHLTEENRKMMERLENESANSAKKLNELTGELERYALVVESLNAELTKRADYDQIHEELRLLRQMEFGSSDTDTMNVSSSLEGTLKTLDQLLVDKNRKLQGDNAQLRTQNEQMNATISTYETELSSLRSNEARQKVLIEKLEVDLVKALKPVAVVSAMQADDSELTSLDVIADSVREINETLLVDDSSYAGIVVAQRDRLKAKVTQLEQERLIQSARVSTLQAEVESIREDNVNLYGKIRFLQSYGAKKGDVAVQLDSERKYVEQYESRMDPFRKFNQQESYKRMNNLKIHDRASLSIGRAIMTSPFARLTFFFYLIILHLLVFLVLYRFAYTESCERDFQQDCIQKFDSHMKEYHHG